MAMGSTASPADGTSWDVPTSSMTNTVVKDGKTYKVLTSWASMWATNGPDYLGISNSCTMLNRSNAGTATQDFEAAQKDTMIGVWGSDANEAPNAYNYNMFYNLYQDAQGLTEKSDTSVVDLTWNSDSGTMGAFKYRPEIIPNNSRLSPNGSAGVLTGNEQVALINKGQFYSAYTDEEQTAVENASDYVRYGDETYNPEYPTLVFMNPFTFANSLYNYANAADKVIADTENYPGTAADTDWKSMNKLPRSNRYEETPQECALNYEKIVKGSLYYIQSKIADGTTKRKKVAYLTETPDASKSTVTVIAFDYVGETAGRAAAGSEGGYSSYSPVAVDQLTTDTVVNSGGAQLSGNSTNGNNETQDLPWTTYTATADDLAQCDYVYCVTGSMDKMQLMNWVSDNATLPDNKTRATTKVDYAGKAPSNLVIGGYSMEKTLYGVYALNFFYPELFPNMELYAYWYDTIYHLKDESIASAMGWAFGNADIPLGTDLSAVGTTYKRSTMEGKFVHGYNYYVTAQNTDPTFSRIKNGGSVNGTGTYTYLNFEPSRKYASWAATQKDPEANNNNSNNNKPNVNNNSKKDNIVKVTVGKVKKITKAKVGKKKIALSWKKVSGAKGYQVLYKVKGKKSWKKVTVKKNKATLKKLKKGKKYQIKVRAYKTSSGKNVYGKYSPVKTSKKVK